MPKLTHNDLRAEFSDTSARHDHPGRKGFELAPSRLFGWFYANATDGHHKDGTAKGVPVRLRKPWEAKRRRLTRAERRLRTGILATI